MALIFFSKDDVDRFEPWKKALKEVLPDLDVRTIYRKLSSSSRFQWLRRQLTPKQQSQILALGIPGIGFRPEKRRFYPGGPTAAYVVGHVNIDNKGIAGMEKYIDGQGLGDLAAAGLTVDESLEPVKLSIDLRVQSVVRDELLQCDTAHAVFHGSWDWHSSVHGH